MIKKSIFIAGIIIIGAQFSCGNSKKVYDESKDMASFNLNDTTEIKFSSLLICKDDPNLFLKFDTIFADSRCPKKANCIWEGNAELGFSITYKKELEAIKLNTYIKMDTEQSLFGYAFKLIDFAPYPGSENAENQMPVAKIVVRKEK